MTTTDPRLDPDSSDRAPVTLNAHQLAYEPPPETGLASAWPWSRVLLMAIIAIVALAGTVLVTVRAAAASEDDATLVSIHLDLTKRTNAGSGPLSPSGSARPARYRSVVVSDGGAELNLRPLGGSVAVTLTQDDANDIVAELDGVRVAPAADDFGDAVADAASSDSINRFVRITPGQAGEAIGLNLFYGRPLASGDYLLVQEMAGDSQIGLTPIDDEGTVLGPAVTIGPRYELNTGHGPSGDASFWASVVSVDRLAAGAASVAGIRVSGTTGELKVVALAKSDLNDDAPTGVAAATAVADDPPAGEGAGPAARYAAIGLTAAVQPAIAVDGAGCETAEQQPASAAAAGQPATYCYAVTNLGTTDLTDVVFTDRALGLDGSVLPRAAGPAVLQPGDRAVYYHHAAAVGGPIDSSTRATARPVDASGQTIADLASPTAGGAATTAELSEAGSGDERSAAGATASPATDPPPAEAPSEAETAGADVATASEAGADGGPAVEVPATTSGHGAPAPAGDEGLGESQAEAVTQLAMTGVATEPWVLVVFAMGFIFFGYTVVTAVRRSSEPTGRSGHEQLDALGFE